MRDGRREWTRREYVRPLIDEYGDVTLIHGVELRLMSKRDMQQDEVIVAEITKADATPRIEHSKAQRMVMR